MIKHEPAPRIQSPPKDDAAPHGESNYTESAKAETSSIHVSALQPSPELEIDTFDELIFNLSYAILQFVQNLETGDAAQLHSAVTDTQQKIRDHYIAVSEVKNVTALHRSLDAMGEKDEDHQMLRVNTEGHKAEADRLRLSLHDQSELLVQAIAERDEVTKIKDKLMMELANEKMQRGEENIELRAFKTEVDRLNEAIIQATAFNQAAVQRVEEALKNAETAIRYKTTAMQVVEKVIRERETAILARDAAKVDRDVVREERDMALRDKSILMRRLGELEKQQAAAENPQVAVKKQQMAAEPQQVVDEEESEKAKARTEAFKALTTKYNEKKRKAPSREGVFGSTPDC